MFVVFDWQELGVNDSGGERGMALLTKKVDRTLSHSPSGVVRIFRMLWGFVDVMVTFEIWMFYRWMNVYNGGKGNKCKVKNYNSQTGFASSR